MLVSKNDVSENLIGRDEGAESQRSPEVPVTDSIIASVPVDRQSNVATIRPVQSAFGLVKL